jgi:hypothetical protein
MRAGFSYESHISEAYPHHIAHNATRRRQLEVWTVRLFPELHRVHHHLLRAVLCCRQDGRENRRILLSPLLYDVRTDRQPHLQDEDPWKDPRAAQHRRVVRQRPLYGLVLPLLRPHSGGPRSRRSRQIDGRTREPGDRAFLKYVVNRSQCNEAQTIYEYVDLKAQCSATRPFSWFDHVPKALPLIQRQTNASLYDRSMTT